MLAVVLRSVKCQVVKVKIYIAGVSTPHIYRSKNKQKLSEVSMASLTYSELTGIKHRK